MGCLLKLQHDTFMPLIEYDVTGIDKPECSHSQQDYYHWRYQ
jgi:hypothetical protein